MWEILRLCKQGILFLTRARNTYKPGQFICIGDALVIELALNSINKLHLGYFLRDLPPNKLVFLRGFLLNCGWMRSQDPAGSLAEHT